MATEPVPGHPAFPQPKNSDTRIWRYMDFPKFEDLATSGDLYMPRSDLLGDPFEASTPEAELAWWEEAAAKADTDEKRTIIQANQQMLNNFARAFQSRHFVSCWHMNETENYAMWCCYTSGAEAVTITTTYDKLRSQLPDDAYLGLVRYIDYQAVRLPTLNLFQHIMHKRHFFAFEQEIRAVYSIALPGPAAGEADIAAIQNQLAEPGYRASVTVRDLIEAVYVHPEASMESLKKVAGICEQAGLPDPVLSGLSGSPT